MWTQIIETVSANRQFIISSHLNPDCDALGSELALAYHLINLDKEVTILNTDPLIPDYQFLDPDHLIEQFTGHDHQLSLISKAEVIMVVDASGGWHRLGKVGDVLAKSPAVSICIDHHPNDKLFTDIAVIDTNVIAAAELIFDLIITMGGRITELMAQALYAAILTDSGSFRFAKTSPQTHRITARLLEYGADPSQVYHRLYQQQPLPRVQLKGYLLKNIKLAGNGQVAYIGLDANTLAAYETDPLDLHSFSNLAQEIRGVKIAILAVELPTSQIKLSLRSDGTIPINTLAAEFGGGGHPPAAGATVSGSLSTIINQVVEKACRLINQDEKKALPD